MSITTPNLSNVFRALWKVFKEKILSSCLDDLGSSFGSSIWNLKQLLPVPILSSYLFLVILLVCFSALSQFWTEDYLHTRATLHALLTVIAPTYSLWPSRYIELASALRSRIDIPLDMIIQDTIDGIIEFRSPINDLAHLVGSGAIVNGHAIYISAGWNWWVDYFEWKLLSKSKPRRRDWSYNKLPSTLDLHMSSFALTLSTSFPLLCLDCLPHSTLPALNAGRKVVLEFTAFSPSLSMLSTSQVVSAIPFIITGRQPRSLVSVLKQLNDSHYPSLAIDSISNVSTNYEHALCRVYKSFSEEHKIREMWMKNLGIKAWRRDMFLVALEASLVRRGWLERWAVQVDVK